jgi:hypothetical protein
VWLFKNHSQGVQAGVLRWRRFHSSFAPRIFLALAGGRRFSPVTTFLPVLASSSKRARLASQEQWHVFIFEEEDFELISTANHTKYANL